MHLRRHKRFYAALGAGAASLTVSEGLAWSVRGLLAGDVFFAAYLAATTAFALRADAAVLRARAAEADEGAPLLLALAAGAAAFSAGGLFLVLNDPAYERPLAVGLALASAPLGWLTVHVMAAFRYAHLFYGRGPARGGLAFPGTEAPGPTEFLYFSLVIGLAAQVSDVSVTNSAMRRAALAHSVLSYFYNTVIIALAVNAAVSLGA